MIAEARIPNDNAEVDGTKYQDREGGKLRQYHSKCAAPFTIALRPGVAGN